MARPTLAQLLAKFIVAESDGVCAPFVLMVVNRMDFYGGPSAKCGCWRGARRYCHAAIIFIGIAPWASAARCRGPRRRGIHGL
eukprot:8762338-Pyramimonas_sp.AAC.1